MDLIQLPVYSFQRGLGEFVAGTYMDEFAEWHSKEFCRPREQTGVVPCAGVSACFSRRAIAVLRDEREGEIFSTSSLTEDYDIAFRLHKLGMREIFVRYPDRVYGGDAQRRRPAGDRRETPADRDPRIFSVGFSCRLSATGALADRHRVPGLVASWLDRRGRPKYFFLRDRKSLITAPAALLAYFVMTLALANTTKSSERASMIRGVVAALVALERRDEAKERFTAALSSADLNDLKHLDIAYLANQVGDDRTADDYFSRGGFERPVAGQGVAGRRLCRKTPVRQYAR